MSIVGILLIALALVAVLVLGGVAGDLVARDPGYVLVTYDGLAMETSLWIAAAGLVLGLLLLWLIVFLVARLLRSWGMLGRWSSKRRRAAAAQRTTQGFLLMAEGQWAQAQRVLEAAAPHAAAPLPNYLSAARAAAAQDLNEARDRLLEQARETTPGSALAVGLVQAELQQQAGEWQASLTLLREMRNGAPKHPGVQRLLLKTLQHLGRHEDLLREAALARKSKALSKAELLEVEASAFAAQIAAAADSQQLQAVVDNLPKPLRDNARVAISLGRRTVVLQRDNAHDADVAKLASIAEPKLRAAIDEVGTDAGAAELVGLYGRLQGADKDRAQALKRWQKRMPQFPALLLAAAQVDVAQGDLAGAEAKVSQALAMHAGADGHLQMAQLCCAKGDAAGASVQLAQAAQVHSADLSLLLLPVTNPAVMAGSAQQGPNPDASNSDSDNSDSDNSDGDNAAAENVTAKDSLDPPADKVRSA